MSYCYECAQKKVVELLAKEPEADYEVDGGWGVEGDSQAFCATCEKMLQNSFTQHACEEEVRHFLTEGFNPACDDDCYAMEWVLGSAGWEPFQERNKSYYVQLDELGRRLLALLGPEGPAAASNLLPQG